MPGDAYVPPAQQAISILVALVGMKMDMVSALMDFSIGC